MFKWVTFDFSRWLTDNRAGSKTSTSKSITHLWFAPSDIGSYKDRVTDLYVTTFLLWHELNSNWVTWTHWLYIESDIYAICLSKTCPVSYRYLIIFSIITSNSKYPKIVYFSTIFLIKHSFAPTYTYTHTYARSHTHTHTRPRPNVDIDPMWIGVSNKTALSGIY